MEVLVGKLVCERLIGGVDTLVVLTIANNVNIGQFVKTVPGVGKPFWYWPAIPAGTVIACDFTSAPVVTAVTATNNTLISAITEIPEDVLTYASE